MSQSHSAYIENVPFGEVPYDIEVRLLFRKHTLKEAERVPIATLSVPEIPPIPEVVDAPKITNVNAPHHEQRSNKIIGHYNYAVCPPTVPIITLSVPEIPPIPEVVDAPKITNAHHEQSSNEIMDYYSSIVDPPTEIDASHVHNPSNVSVGQLETRCSSCSGHSSAMDVYSATETVVTGSHAISYTMDQSQKTARGTEKVIRPGVVDLDTVRRNHGGDVVFVFNPSRAPIVVCVVDDEGTHLLAKDKGAVPML